MNGIINLWNLILESNTFNFVVLLVILVIVMQKLHISDALENIKNEIIENIEKAKKTKQEAELSLADAKAKIEHLDDELGERIALATQQAHNVGEQIQENTKRRIKQIENNIEKVIETEEKTIITSLSDETSMESIKLAEEIKRKKLKDDPSLHDRYIQESIDELEKAVL